MPRPKPKKNTRPTNFDLQTAFDEHAKEDKIFQDETRGFNGEMSAFRAETEGSLADLHATIGTIDAKMEVLASKEDIKELKTFMEKVNIGVGIFNFSWKNAGSIGSFLMLILGLFLFFKVGIVGLVAWIFNR